jgi:hypothetical protein
MHLTYAPLGPATFDDFVSLHGRPECQGCFCMYWHFAGDNRAWQLRQGEENRADMHALVAQGRAHAMLAYRGAAVVGTLQFEPRGELRKLTSRMPYRDLGPAAGAWALTCFRVGLDARRQGVARGLLAATLAHLREAHDARAVEAFPRVGDALRDEEVFTGPEALFTAAGFVLVRAHVQYPVYRWTREP